LVTIRHQRDVRERPFGASSRTLVAVYVGAQNGLFGGGRLL